MAKKVYVCSECGNTINKWYGKCPKCGSFGTMTESAVEDTPKTVGRKSVATTPVKPAMTIAQLRGRPIVRTATGISELDRVLGGGFVDGEVVLLAGQPGAGKSTMCMSIADCFAGQGVKVLYCSGEESEQQIGLRAKRMGIDNDNIRIVNETNLERVLGYLEQEKPGFFILDSVQTVGSDKLAGAIGGVQQSREVVHVLTRAAKENSVSMVLISQIVKSGDFSGSEAIQHIVDATLMLESDKGTPLKFLRATKNRFGDTSEVGIFQHEEKGLVEVSDPSGVLLEAADEGDMVGASSTFISEGIRQMPVEVQALVSASTLPQPRKQFNGIDYQRGQIVCAILDKFCSTRLYAHDVFISTVSGVKVRDPQADLAIAASLISSDKNIPVPKGYAFIGELSLTGKIRGSFMIEQKVKEAKRLGFTTIVVPKRTRKTPGVIRVDRITDLVDVLKN